LGGGGNSRKETATTSVLLSQKGEGGDREFSAAVPVRAKGKERRGGGKKRNVKF